jgi:hypothetical protein
VLASGILGGTWNSFQGSGTRKPERDRRIGGGQFAGMKPKFHARSEPAKDEMAAGRRKAWFRGLLLRDRSRRVRGSRPDSQPAPRMVQPLIPELSAFVAGDELSSIETPLAPIDEVPIRALPRMPEIPSNPAEI